MIKEEQIINMQLEVGAIIEGKVTGITKFGAFVELPTGKTGMVHISEVSSSYVKEISDHLSENQMVKVKVLSISPEGKVSLSIKKCQDAAQGEQTRQASPSPRQQSSPPPRRQFREQGWRGPKQSATDNLSFEDMMAKFKQTSDDKMSDLKRSTEFRKGSSRRGSAK